MGELLDNCGMPAGLTAFERDGVRLTIDTREDPSLGPAGLTRVTLRDDTGTRVTIRLDDFTTVQLVQLLRSTVPGL